jgi:hypothetical protein
MRIPQKSLLGILSFSVILYSFANIFKSGINWDSIFDLNAANTTTQIKGISSLTVAYDQIPLTSEFYGIFIYQLSNVLHRLLLFDKLDFNIQTLANLQFINATSFLLTLLSIFIMTFTINKITNSKRFASIFFLISITSPSWIGMSQINTKDMPFAAGLTILTSGMMLLINFLPSKKSFLYAFLLSTCGAFIAVGTRVGGLFIVIVILMISLSLFLIKNRNSFHLSHLFISTLFFLFTTLATLLVLLYSSNPLARIDLFKWLKDAFVVSGKFPSIQPVKALGRDFLSDQLPSWYIPAWIFAQLPVLLGILLLVGIAQILYLIILNKKSKLFYFFTPLFVQGLLLPIFLVLQNVNMYNGIRHVYFIFPALFLIASFPISEWNINYRKVHNVNFYSNVIAGLLICANIFALIRWMPYSYAYINPVAGLGQSRNWDLDYWGVTAIEGVSKLRRDTGINKVVVMPDISSSVPLGSLPAGNFQESNSNFGLYVYIHWNHKILREKCDVLFDIKRDNQILGMGGICPKKGQLVQKDFFD